MRIWYVANIRFPTEKAHGIHIAKASEALVQNGQEVTLLVPNRSTPISQEAVTYYGLQTSFPIERLFTLDFVQLGKIGFWIESFVFAFSVAWCLRKNKEDIVFSRDEIVLWTLSLFGAQNIIWESHDGTWNFFSRFIAKKAKGIVVVSSGLREFYIQKGISGEKILHTPNGIDLADFSEPESKESARKHLNITEDKKIALYIGRLDGWKGVSVLLEASRYLPDRAQIVIIGGEAKQIVPLKEKYKAVRFLGFRPYNELPNNQAAADVLVVPNTGKNDVSVRFTSPLKLIAHMASHRPIVASDLPSIRELVNDESAVLVRPDDPEALARGIMRAVEGDLGQRLEKNAFTAVSKLDWSLRAQRIIAFIERVIG